MIWLCIVLTSLGITEIAVGAPSDEVLVDFSQASLPEFVQFNNTTSGAKNGRGTGSGVCPCRLAECVSESP